MWVNERKRLDGVRMKVGVNQSGRDEHRREALDNGRDSEVSSYGVLRKDPHLARQHDPRLP